MGRIEIFLQCEEIQPISRSVQENLEFETWYQASGTPLVANRLLLPAVGFFDQVAAFLCTELLRNGGGIDPIGAFRKTEPVIELAIERLRISDNEFLGLCGEILVLRELITLADSKQVRAILKAWRGYGESSRDFQLGPVGVEVKSTTGNASIHHIAGVNQVEVGHGVDDQDESDLQLVSVGILWLENDDPGAYRLPSMIDGIFGRIEDALGDQARPACEDLKSKIAQYGATRDVGYEHDSMSRERYFNRAFQVVFVRCYDMLDYRIGVLRTEDVVAKSNVRLESVRFSISLPDQVNGDLNPVLGLAATARHILKLSNSRL
jgi:hypothetical protein